MHKNKKANKELILENQLDSNWLCNKVVYIEVGELDIYWVKTNPERMIYKCIVSRCLIYDLGIIDEQIINEQWITDWEPN